MDILTSADFYQKVFNWTISSDKLGNLSFDDAVGEVSGTWVTGRSPASRSGFCICIMVDSIKETMALITSNGGQAIPINSESAQNRGSFRDPAGNFWSLYQL